MIDLAHRFPPRWPALAAAVALLSACATAPLPADEATAFRKLSVANREAFAGITNGESAAATEFAVRNVAIGRGDIQVDGCTADSDRPCRLGYDLNGIAVDLGVPAPNTRALIVAIADYGQRMGDLAEAKDIDELGGKAAAAGDAVRGLFEVVPGAGAFVNPIVDLAVRAYKGKLVDKRRQLLLANAEAAKPAIDKAAETIQGIGEKSRNVIVLGSAQAVRAAQLDLDDSKAEGAALEKRAERLRTLAARGSHWAQDSLDTVEQRQLDLRERRAAQAMELIRAARTLNAAKKPLDKDFSKLSEAHNALIEKLRNPQAGIEESLADLKTFLAVLDQFAAIGKS